MYCLVKAASVGSRRGVGGNVDRMEWRRRVRSRLIWEDCVKTDLAVVGGDWRTTARDGGAVTGGGYSSEMGTVIEGETNQ